LIGGCDVASRESRGRVRAPRAPLFLSAILAGGLILPALLPSAAAGASLPQREGVVLYRKKCGGCHRPYAPSELPADKWAKVLPEMEVRAKLTPDEAETIRRYLEPDLAPSHAAKPTSP
jgi:mono/diheme cytochrome c family protein